MSTLSLFTFFYKRAILNIIKQNPSISCIDLWLHFPRFTNDKISNLLNELDQEWKIELKDGKLIIRSK